MCRFMTGQRDIPRTNFPSLSKMKTNLRNRPLHIATEKTFCQRPIQGLLTLTVLFLLMIQGVPASAISVDPPVAANDAAIDWQWVGLDKDADTPCPRPGNSGWIVDKLFVPVGGGGIPNIPPALRPFCLYSWAPPGSVPAAALASLNALLPGQLSALEEDSLSVTTSGALETALRSGFEHEFLEQAGATPPLAAGSRPPYLAIVDTSIDDSTHAYRNVGKSPHGYTLLNLARALLCQTSPCSAQISSSLAMPFYRQAGQVKRDTTIGGMYGSVAELARGVQREVARWAGLNPDRSLILNLSLGWDPAFGGGEATVPAMPLAVRAAYASLADARCRGALVVAAAGNDPGGRITRGPIYPAAWEQRAAPDLGACTAALGSAPPARLFPTTGPAYRPLVYAVSGIQADGEQLANRRPGAGAALVAYADHGTAPGASGPTAVLTGSSVATLIASAAAAQVWSHLPGLRADQVMGHVYQGGDIVSGTPNFVLTPSRTLRPHIRRASICSAQHRACTVSGRCATSPPTCPVWDKKALDLTPSLELAAFETATTVDLSGKTTTASLPKACHRRSIALGEDETTPTDPCPDRQYRSTQGAPWETDPQPGSSFCPSCPLNESTDTLLLETDDSDPSAVWTNPMLILCDTTYDLDITELRAGDVFEVTGISLGSCTEAWLTAITGSGGSVTSPLVIGSSS